MKLLSLRMAAAHLRDRCTLFMTVGGVGLTNHACPWMPLLPQDRQISAQHPWTYNKQVMARWGLLLGGCHNRLAPAMRRCTHPKRAVDSGVRLCSTREDHSNVLT